MPLPIDRMTSEELTQYEERQPQSLDRMNPQEASIPRFSGDPFNGSIKPEKEIPLRGMEREFAEWSPNVYAGMRTILDLFPFASYALPSARDEFVQMSQEEQTQALLWDSLGAALWGSFPRLGKDVKYLFGATVGKVLRAPGKYIQAGKPTVMPYEDAVKGLESLGVGDKVRPFVWAEEAKTKLVNRGFGKDEAEAVVGSLVTKSDDSLLNVIVERRYQGKEMTKEFEKATFWRTGGAYPKRQLRKELVEEFGEDVLRAKFYGKQFEKLLTKEVLKVQPAQRTTDFIFKAHLERLYPNKVGAGYGDVTPAQMANILLDTMEHKAVSWQVQNPTLLASLKPARVVFGYGERVLGAMNGIYKPTVASLARMNKNFFDNSLLFAKMLEQRGIGKVVIKKNGEFTLKRAKWASPKVFREVHEAMVKLDGLSMAAERATDKTMVAELQQEIAQAGKMMSPGAKVIMETTRGYLDHLYASHVKMQIPRVFGKAKLTRLGRAKTDEMLTGPGGLNYEVGRLFATKSGKNFTEKVAGMKKVLEKVREKLVFEGKTHPYFEETGEELAKTLERLEKEFSWGKDGFMRYHDNYVARVSKHEDALLKRWRGGLFKDQGAFHTKLRTLEKQRGAPVDFETMIQARTMAHSKEHFLYDKLTEVVNFTEGLPPAWIEYTESYLSGILGVPTIGDYKVAQFLTKTVGGLARVTKMGEGLWNETRVINFAYTINNLTYLGGLGFKPFSATRNLFQPLLTVPADLGGAKDLGSLVEGYRWAFNPKNRAYIQDIGAIAEYAPEIHMRPRIFRLGKTLQGRELPTLESVRDVGMWMFRGSDRFNRYVTGGAAVTKWDRLMSRFGGEVKPQNVAKFSKKLGLDRRYEWSRMEVEDLLFRGKFAKAKATYVRDVIADTQYLYGAAEAPVALRKYGATGRTALIFQSWWMNYGTLMNKWLTTGASPGAKVERLFTMMLSQSMAYSLMSPMWGKQTAVRSTFLGPFPKEFNEFLLPPAWAPVYHAGAAVLGIQNPKVSARHAKAVLDTSVIFLPGGLQAKTFYRGAKKEGFEGFSRAILRLKTPE